MACACRRRNEATTKSVCLCSRATGSVGFQKMLSESSTQASCSKLAIEQPNSILAPRGCDKAAGIRTFCSFTTSFLDSDCIEYLLNTAFVHTRLNSFSESDIHRSWASRQSTVLGNTCSTNSSSQSSMHIRGILQERTWRRRLSISPMVRL